MRSGLLIYSNDAINIESLYYIANNFPDLNKEASEKALSLIKNSFYGTKRLEYFQGCLSIRPSQSDILTIKKRVKEDITELQYTIEEINSRLDDATEQHISENISKLRECILHQALLCLSMDSFQLASTNLTYFASNYSNNSYVFRDMEIRSSISYLSQNYTFVDQFTNKVFKTVHCLNGMAYEEIIGLIRTSCIIIMCEFKLKNYSKALDYFCLISELCSKSTEYDELLNKCVITFNSRDEKEYFNVVNSNDFKISILFSILIVSTDNDISVWIKNYFFQSLFTDFPIIWDFVEAFLLKKFALQAVISNKISKILEICTINFQRDDDLFQITHLLLLRNIIFYFSIVEKISLSQLLNTFGIERKKLLPVIIQLIRVMELNIIYTPSNEIFERKANIVYEPLNNLPILLKNLEAGNEATILQNQILDTIIS